MNSAWAATDCKWTGGGTDTKWSTPANWHNSTVPTSSEHNARFVSSDVTVNNFVALLDGAHDCTVLHVSGSSAANPWTFEAADSSSGLTIVDDGWLGYFADGWLWLKSGTYTFEKSLRAGIDVNKSGTYRSDKFPLWLKVGDGESDVTLNVKGTYGPIFGSSSEFVAEKATLDFTGKDFAMYSSSSARIAKSTMTVGAVKLNGTSSMTLSDSTMTVGNDLNIADASNADCTLSGNSSTINLTGSWRVFNVGNGENSIGTVIKDGGDWSGYYLRIGNGSGSTGTFTQNSGTLTLPHADDHTTEFGIGTKGDGTFTLNGGTVTLDSDSNQYIGRDSVSSGTLNLNGGMFVASCLRRNNDGATATINFNGGTLKANYSDSRGLVASGVTVNAGEKGGTIDSGNMAISVDAAIGGTGGMRFKGGNTITLKGANGYEGGTTVELGTTLATADETAKNTILGNLVIDGRAKLNPTDYVVFEYSAGGLTKDDLDHVSFTNCAAETTSKIVDGNKIVVTLAEATCVPKTENKLMVFKDVTLADIEFAEFSSRMCGGYVDEQFGAVDAAKGYNKKMYYDGGKLSSIIVEFQVRDGSNTKCVVVKFTDDGSDVYATGLGAKYSSDAIGKEFYEYNGTWRGTDPNSKPENRYAETVNANGYGVCDIRWTPGEKPAWTIDEDKNWSEFEGYNSLNPDETVSIYATGNYTLTMDVDATVAGIAITGAGGATLSVAPGKTLTVGDISGIGNIVNKGTLVKTGDGTVAWPFDNASTGTTTVSSGTLKVARVKTVSENLYGFKPDGVNHEVRVATGATFDLNGEKDLTVSVRLAESATFANYGAAIDYYKMQTVQIILDGNATAAFSNDFGLIAPGYKETKLDLGANTLTLDGAGKNFWLCNTKISGTGTIRVRHGFLNTTSKASIGENCTLDVPDGGALILNADLTVKNFVNGTINDIASNATLTVLGTLTPGTKAIPKLTLADGAKVKATGTAQVVSETFSASGTITVDASEIDAQTLKAAGETGIPVLTVPTAQVPSGVNWPVSSEPIAGTRAKWRIDDDGNTKTLYVVKPTGLRVIIR